MVEATMRPCDAFHRKVHTAKSLLADPVESIVQEGDTLWLGIFCEIRIAFEYALCDFRWFIIKWFANLLLYIPSICWG